MPQSCSPIGLDLGRHAIKAVQLRGAGRRLRLGSAICFPRLSPDAPVDGAEIQRLRAILNRAGFRGNRAVLAVPAADLMTSMLELPPRSAGMPFDQIARMEFARIHKCEPAGLELSHWDLPQPARASKEAHLMAVAYAHTAADAHLDVIESAGLDVVAMDAASSALARACQTLHDQATTAILDLGYIEASLALVQAGTVIYQRAFPDAGLKKLTVSLQNQLDLDESQVQYVIGDGGFDDPGDRRGTEQFAVARRVITAYFAPVFAELRMTFDYAEQQYPQAPVKSMLLVGGGATIARIDQHARQILGIPVRSVRPSDVVECPSPMLARLTPTMMAAVGLAQFCQD